MGGSCGRRWGIWSFGGEITRGISPKLAHTSPNQLTSGPNIPPWKQWVAKASQDSSHLASSPLTEDVSEPNPPNRLTGLGRPRHHMCPIPNHLTPSQTGSHLDRIFPHGNNGLQRHPKTPHTWLPVRSQRTSANPIPQTGSHLPKPAHISLSDICSIQKAHDLRCE
jgi:hypothetical protein